MKLKLKIVLSVFAVAIMTGCVPRQISPPIADNFVFTPPSSVTSSKSGMSIAILKPVTSGSFFVSEAPSNASTKIIMTRMLDAMQTDIEKVIIARGFTTAGSYPTIDEMTYSQKELSALILRPTINIDMVVDRSQATVSGNVVLELLEPMSREKVWVKHLELAPFTNNNVRFEHSLIQTAQGLQSVKMISKNSVTELLNAFYQPAMQKIWSQLETREIQNLKTDTDKLKGRTQYRGG